MFRPGVDLLPAAARLTGSPAAAPVPGTGCVPYMPPRPAAAPDPRGGARGANPQDPDAGSGLPTRPAAADWHHRRYDTATGYYTGNEGSGGGVFDGRIGLGTDFNEKWR
ncbi:hypothetical protein ACWD0G_26145, partial [Streptomyces goshikiensis]